MPNSFDYLDLGQFRSLYCERENPRAMKFFVEGVRCSKCIAKIENLSLRNPDLNRLEVDLANQMAFVELKSPDLSFGRVAEEISGLGFRVVPLQPEEDAVSKWKQESRRDLVRLGVAAFCAGNIMMLAFATYFGLSGEMKSQFEYLQLALYLPVVTFVAYPFYQGFFSGLRQKSLSIDGPMAVASFLGFAVSTWNLFRQTGSIYYDSLSGFLFLILATRFAQKRTRFQYLKYLRPTALAETLKARLLKGEGWVWVRSDQLAKDNTILVEKNEWIPADGLLINSEAVIDLSVLNGESLPRRIQTGFAVKAGSRLLTDSAQIVVQKSGAQTLLGHLLSSLKRDSFDDTEFSKLSNRASQILLQIVLAIAALTLISGFFLNFEVQFEKALALIILACPCAMAFGTPLAFSFSMKRAQDRQIIVKSAKVFEAIRTVKTVFLDKTGTLTERFWNLTHSSLETVPEHFKQVILALESRSQHPIAFALREIWSQVKIPADLQVANYQEIPSLGVQGDLQGHHWQFKSFQEGSAKSFGLFQDQKMVWSFQLNPVFQEGSREAVQFLLKRGYDVRLLSGDTKAETMKAAEALGLSESAVSADLTPQRKSEIVQMTPNCMMIGDGVNDSLALQAAQVGIAVKGGVDLALQSADVLFLNEGLGSLPELMKIAGNARGQIRRNLTSALVYNVIGGVAALLGWVNPFVAALLMPASSLYILATTWWGTRK